MTMDRTAKLRQLAEELAWELHGFCEILWPRTQRQLATLREAWALIEPEARAGTLTGKLELLNFDREGPGWRPRAYYEFDLGTARSRALRSASLPRQRRS
jgi:hypothetical protein